VNLELDGKTAFVAASSKGLGQAVAKQFVQEGATVAISSRSKENLEQAREHIISATDAESERVITIPCDLSEPDEMADSVEAGIDELGRLDCLVTNHPGPPSKEFEKTSTDDLDRAYESILESTFVLVKTCMPHLERSEGSITNLVSGSVREPTTHNTLSNFLRPSLFSFSKSLANEYGGECVRVNCVCPRGIMTDRIEHKLELIAEEDGTSLSDATSQRTEDIPLGRLGEPEEFAKGVVFVASDAASFVNGAVLQIDGGWSQSAF
jgi:3-oxoacyl-[acyl-carrier protein] reductase